MRKGPVIEPEAVSPLTCLTPAMVYDAAIALLPHLTAAEPGQTQSV
jgi:hypothetical protein